MPKLSLARASVWSTAAILIKLAVGLLLIKLLALTFGPEGVGCAGNFMTLITVLGVLSGAGIYNGVTKYVAEFQFDAVRLHRLFGTSALIVLGSATLLALVLIVAAAPLSRLLFGREDLQGVLRVVAFIQFGIAFANLFLAILRGRCDAQGVALSVMIGNLFGLGAYWMACRLGGYPGALIGLALLPALLIVPAAIALLKRKFVPWHGLKLTWDSQLARGLFKFTAMAVITSLTLPIAYVMIRQLLATHYSWEEVGIWQGVNKISDAYLQLITAPFTVYLLPTLARHKTKKELAYEISRVQRFLLPLALGLSLSVWLLRDVVIELLFSAEFRPMRDLFAWQLSGDVFKVGAYVFGYLIIAKASLRFYVLAEIVQFSLLLLFSYWLIPSGGALGTVQAYAVTYAVHFALCLYVFFIYCKRGE
ncbi:lipid III flippase WzxE [Mycoavidus sp. SF9855]|uniref:lipid III flippase WzxE n=1 Tax=Mycoavidus sp. SF9855 TaxID=2968475 RepID=UPI00211CCDAF|nr:lipid III flippase WzxE [Mycoavidus sp. SF9855]UUM21096.1 lipid III flippase WzxE [Mycoavidus sp. SF9855]